MNISRTDLVKAVKAKILTEDQANNLYDFIKNQPEQSSSFTMTNVLYYLGGLIAIGAMSLFYEPWLGSIWWLGIFFLALVYAVIGLYLSSLFKKKKLNVPAGICTTFAVALTPLAIYGLQKAMGWWPDDSVYQDYHSYIRWHWIFMELGTLIVGLVLAWIYRYPFMLMPIAVTLWYMSMDLTSMLTGGDIDVGLSTLVSMYFGLLTLLIAFWTDIESRQTADYAFWLYLFGVIIFWGGLTGQQSTSEFSQFVYLCINLLMIIIGVILVRKVFVVFGALGCCIYLGHLASVIFKNSLLFPFALSVIGLAIIYLGTLWQKHEAAITHKAQSLLPKALQELLQNRH